MMVGDNFELLDCFPGYIVKIFKS